MLKFLIFAVALLIVGGITCAAAQAYPISTDVVAPPGAPVVAVGCTAAKENSDSGDLSDYYLVGNASFINNSSKTAVEVDITIRYTYSEYDLHHDVLLIKRGAFSPGVRIDPRRNAAMSFFGIGDRTNIDVDGYREIDVWDPFMASCIVTFAEFSDGTTWSWNLKK